jgi:hypothetical protein
LNPSSERGVLCAALLAPLDRALFFSGRAGKVAHSHQCISEKSHHQSGEFVHDLPTAQNGSTSTRPKSRDLAPFGFLSRKNPDAHDSVPSDNPLRRSSL